MDRFGSSRAFGAVWIMYPTKDRVPLSSVGKKVSPNDTKGEKILFESAPNDTGYLDVIWSVTAY